MFTLHRIKTLVPHASYSHVVVSCFKITGIYSLICSSYLVQKEDSQTFSL